MVETKEFRKELGRRLAAVRAYRELSIPDVTALTGISTSAISRYERGERPIPAERLFVLAETYDVPMAELLPLDGDLPTRVWSNPELLVPAA